MMRLMIIWLVLLPHVISSQNIKVAAAADLHYALDEIVKAYKSEKSDINIEVVYGSSGNAFAQISNGAPFDIYFSADKMYPLKLKEMGLTLTEPKLYAIGRMVLWSSNIDVSIGLKALLSKPEIKIAIANPEHAPYGQRAVESLKYDSIYDSIKNQLVFGENISQAAQFCLSGNADAGLLALSLVLSPAMNNQGKYYLIDEKSYRPLEQTYVILNQAKGKSEVFAFAEFIGSKSAREIFEKYGFTLPR